MALFLFFDESGLLDFHPRAGSHYYFGVLSTREPAMVSQALEPIRYGLLAEGAAADRLHAAEDRQAIRERVFATLRAVSGLVFDSAIVDKRAVPAGLREPAQFYSYYGSLLLEQVFRHDTGGDERVVVITDTLPVHRRRGAVRQAMKASLYRYLHERPFTLLHAPSAAHAGLQAADYFMWAVQRKHRRGDGRAFNLIECYVRLQLIW